MQEAGNKSDNLDMLLRAPQYWKNRIFTFSAFIYFAIMEGCFPRLLEQLYLERMNPSSIRLKVLGLKNKKGVIAQVYVCVCVYIQYESAHMKFPICGAFHLQRQKRQDHKGRGNAWPVAVLGMCDSADSEVRDEAHVFTFPRMLSWFGSKQELVNVWNSEGILLFTACGFHAFRNDGKKTPTKQTDLIPKHAGHKLTPYTSHKNLPIC